MPERFIFRHVDYRDVELFLQDREIRAKNHPNMQRCHRASHSTIVDRRGDGGLRTPCKRVINDFVPFYFAPKTSMFAGIIMGNVELYSPDNEHLGKATTRERVFFTSRVSNFRNYNGSFYYTNIACNQVAVQPTFSNDLDQIENIVNWPLFSGPNIIARIPEIGYTGVEKWCHDTDTHPNRKSQRMAEFLVQSAFPISLTDCIVTQNDDVKDELENVMMASPIKIPLICRPECFL